MRLIGFDKEELGGFINDVQDDPAVGDRDGRPQPIGGMASRARRTSAPTACGRCSTSKGTPRWHEPRAFMPCGMQQGTIGRTDADVVGRAAVLRSTGRR